MMDDMKNALMARLRSMDWHYDFSDDHRVWTRGRSAYAALQNDANQLSTEDLQTIKNDASDNASIVCFITAILASRENQLITQ
jgi:hypothetical protein